MTARQDKLSRALGAGFLLCCAIFLISLGFRPYPGSWLVKVLPMICLLLLAPRMLPGREGRLLAMGYGFSTLGDILLELSGPGLFEAGMGAFILAHLCYIRLFLGRPSFQPSRVLAAGVLTCAVFGFGLYLFPRLGAMALPILVYLAVILAMGLFACLGRHSHWLTITGAALFILSDSLIAFAMFVSPLDQGSLWVMGTYYGAQALLGAGVRASVRQRAQGNPGA